MRARLPHDGRRRGNGDLWDLYGSKPHLHERPHEQDGWDRDDFFSKREKSFYHSLAIRTTWTLNRRSSCSVFWICLFTNQYIQVQIIWVGRSTGAFPENSTLLKWPRKIFLSESLTLKSCPISKYNEGSNKFPSNQIPNSKSKPLYEGIFHPKSQVNLTMWIINFYMAVYFRWIWPCGLQGEENKMPISLRRPSQLFSLSKLRLYNICNWNVSLEAIQK